MSIKHKIDVVSRAHPTEPLYFHDVDTVTLIDDESHGVAAIGRNLETGEVRLLVSSPAVVTVRIEAV